ncbi:hypothetical protein ACFLV1_00395 [Chloroflexota bacterium]
MSKMTVLNREISLGHQMHHLRLNLGLSPGILAKRAGTSTEEVRLIEHNLPVRLDARRRILRELLATKSRQH